jgi:hypothetical protein
MNDAAYHTSNCWLFPKIVFGDMRTTRRLCKKVAQESISSQEWCWPASDADFVDVRDSDTPIVVERAIRDFAPDRSVPLWRPYWVAEFDDITDDWNSNDKTGTAMLLAGMRSLWFTVGMLCFVPRFRRPEHHRELLERYVFWLPEIEALAPRFRSEGQDSRMFWAIKMWHCALHLKYIEWTEASAERLRDEFFAVGNISEWLLANGVMTPDGSRYALMPAPLLGSTE